MVLKGHYLFYYREDLGELIEAVGCNEENLRKRKQKARRKFISLKSKEYENIWNI